jgi:hypothetical protein
MMPSIEWELLGSGWYHWTCSCGEEATISGVTAAYQSGKAHQAAFHA